MKNIILAMLEEITALLKNNNVDKWMDMRSVQKYTGLSKSTIHRAVQRGQLKVSQATGKNLFHISWVDTFLGLKR